jgi:DNA-binding MarR family transcriptional regulator
MGCDSEQEGAMSQEAELQRVIRHLISHTGDLKHRRVHELLDELGLYRGQTSVLRALWEQDGLTQSELADRLNRSPSTITKAAQRLEKSGFARRCPDDSDERVSRVFLTETGRGIQPAVEEMWSRLDQEIFKGFSLQELALLADFLGRVCRNIKSKS